MSAPERREPQSEAVLDSRPPSLRSSLSSLFHIPLRARSPPHTLSRSPPAPTSPTSTHHHPVRAVVLSLSFSLGQILLSGPSHSPYSRPQPCPCPQCLSNLTLTNPSVATYPPPPSCTAVIPSYPLALSFPRVPTYLLTTFTLGSVSAPPCQFLCETTNGAARYLPT